MRDNTRYSNSERYTIKLTDGRSYINWSEPGGGGIVDNIISSTTHITDKSSISFDKKAGGDTALIGKNIGEVNLSSFVLDGRVRCFIYLPSILDVLEVQIYLTEDISNYVLYTEDVSSLTDGWNFISLDLNTGTQTGSGIDWNSVKGLYVGVKFNADSAVLAGMLLDSVYVDMANTSISVDTSSSSSSTGSSVSPTQGREYFNPQDFSVSYTSASGITLDGLSFIPQSEEFLGVFAHTTGSGLRFYDPVNYELDYDYSSGLLNIGGDVFLGSNDEFRVVVAGPPRAYSAVTDTLETYNTNQPWEQYSGGIFMNDTNITDGSYDFYLDMQGFTNSSFQFILDNGSGSITGTISGTLEFDKTDASSCTNYYDITYDTFGITTVTGTSFLVDHQAKTAGYRFLKIWFEVDTGGLNDSSINAQYKQWWH